MNPYHTTHYGNASSLHLQARNAAEAIEEAREHVAHYLRAKPEEIIFSSGGTESDNLAIKGVIEKHEFSKQVKGPHIITSSIEHPAILNTCKYLEKKGYKVAYLPVDDQGMVHVSDLEETLSKDTIIVSIMYANNEIGTIQPIEKLAKITHDYEAIFHTDAVQAIGKIPIDVKKEDIDLLTISGHKFYGPKGVGALFKRQDVKLSPILHGGGHELNLRSGTENTPGIVGIGEAIRIATDRMSTDMKIIQGLRNTLIKSTLEIEESYLNGHPSNRLPNNAHFRFTAIEGESLIMLLDDKGIMASTGSACSSADLTASHVLLAIGLKPEEAHGSLRITLGRTNTKEEINYISESLPNIIQTLRNMSPLWKKQKEN